MRKVGCFGRGLAALVLCLSGLSPAFAQSVDPALEGRVFQTSDGALWIYKDGLRYPLVGLDLSDEQIDAISPRLDQPVERVNDLFAVGGLPLTTPPPPAPMVEAAPASAALPTLDVSNPHDYETVPTSLHVSGVAFDPLAVSGSGIDRVQVFNEDRDAGGFKMGETVPSSAMLPNSWDMVVNLPAGPHNIYFYARSAVTGNEAVLHIPVRVGP